MKQSVTTTLLAVLMSMVGLKTFAYDIAVANTDGVTIYYEWTNDTELAVSSYNNYYTGTVVIPKSININGNTYPVTSIDSYAFYGCNGLTSVTIPISVISIGNFAFYGCSSLTTIVSEIDNPFSVDNSIFNGIDSNVLLIVPKGKKTIYQSTAGWNQFMNIVEYEKRKTIHVATAGTLPDLILNYEKNLIEELTLTGELNGTDLAFLRQMAGQISMIHSTSSDIDDISDLDEDFFC